MRRGLRKIYNRWYGGASKKTSDSIMERGKLKNVREPSCGGDGTTTTKFSGWPSFRLHRGVCRVCISHTGLGVCVCVMGGGEFGVWILIVLYCYADACNLWSDGA